MCYALFTLLLLTEVYCITSVSGKPSFSAVAWFPLTNATNDIVTFSFVQKTEGVLEQANSGDCWAVGLLRHKVQQHSKTDDVFSSLTFCFLSTSCYEQASLLGNSNPLWQILKNQLVFTIKLEEKSECCVQHSVSVC